MAIQYRLTDVQEIRLVEERGVWSLELQTRYVRYQLLLDDVAKVDEMIATLQRLPKQKVEKTSPAPKLPRFTKLDW